MTLRIRLALAIAISFFMSGVIHAKEPVKVSILADDSYPPYSYVKGGELTGIYVDLVREALNY